MRDRKNNRRPFRRSFREAFPGRNREKRIHKLSLAAVLPNITTILALCCGMTAIRMALLQRWDWVVTTILVAGFLDGMDGRLARMLGSTSRFGAELDSFSDVISFGVAPAVVIYLLGLNNLGEIGWGVALFFTVCMALRLARFNTLSIEDAGPPWPHSFFMGVPAPAAAYLGLMPIILQHAFETCSLFKAPLFYAFSLFLTGCLMVSKIPTFSLKKVIVPTRFVLPLILLVVIIAILLYSHPWIILSVIGVGYVITIPFSMRAFLRLKVREETTLSRTPSV